LKGTVILIDPTAFATWIVGGATIITMVVLAGLGSYLGSIRSVGKIKADMTENFGKIETKQAENHGVIKESLAEVKTTVADTRIWVQDIAQGKSPHIATINAKLDEHGRTLEDHGRRIGTIEHEHTVQMAKGGCKL
jgi:hypothetical protein